jgi:hypothetical protein
MPLCFEKVISYPKLCTVNFIRYDEWYQLFLSWRASISIILREIHYSRHALRNSYQIRQKWYQTMSLNEDLNIGIMLRGSH